MGEAGESTGPTASVGAPALAFVPLDDRPASSSPAAVTAAASAPRATSGVLRTAALAALVTSTALAVAVTFAPWLRTGSARRTSYEVVRAADHLDVLSPGAQSIVSVTWAFLPLVAVLAVLATTLDRPRLAASLALLVGLVEVGLAVVVTNAPRSADWGATAGLATGTTLAVVSLATARITRSTR